jgi:hypothetical protein
MEADHPRNRTELDHFLAVLTQPGDDGQPFIVVGGHAVNYWAKLYLPREPRLHSHLPFTSKDLDVIGSEASARRVAQALGWQYSPPIVGGGPVQGVISSPATDHPLTVEFLWEIKGVPHQTIHDFVRENTFQPEGSDQPVRVRVLDPVLLMHGKIRNAVDIEQGRPEKPRQDVKHVAMLSLCVPHFLDDVRVQVSDEMKRKESLGNYIQALNALKHNYSGRHFEAQQPGLIHWQELIPVSIRQMVFDSQVQSLLRQLGGEGQSRGMGI